MDTVQRWILRGGAFALPLVYVPTVYDSAVLPKLALARLMVLALAVIVAARWSLGRSVRRRRIDVTLPVLAFLASAAISTVFAVNRTVALFGTYTRYEGLLTIATYTALFVLVTHSLRDTQDARATLRALIAGATVAALIGILQTVLASSTLGGESGETAVSYAGVIRAGSTLGNAATLGMLLAMVLPLCIAEVAGARSLSSRIIALNATLIIGIGLALTFSRSAWLGAALAMVVMVGAHRRVSRRSAGVALAAIIVAGTGLALSATLMRTGPVAALADRLESIGSPTAGSGGTRLGIWDDTLHLVAARPVVGSGPDTVGLVFSQHQTADWSQGVPIDETSSQILQVAATQGIIGVACYVWILMAFVRSFVRGTKSSIAIAAFAGIVAYQAAVQFNFSWVPAAAPFWLFGAAAVITWDSQPVHAAVAPKRRRLGLRAATVPVVGLVAAAVCAAFLVAPLIADRYFLDALGAMQRGDRTVAAQEIDSARRFAPQESAYAKLAGDIALDVDIGDTPGRDANPSLAATDYSAAISLGTLQSAAYRRLAIADVMLGRRQAALVAVRQAVALAPYDSQAAVLEQQIVAGAPLNPPG